MKIKTGDKVIVLSGKDKGKTGKVISADPKNGQDGGIMKIETPVYVSKVQLVCPKCGKGTRVGYKFVDGKKIRVCKQKKCGAEI